jgi:hypothetical protein
MSNRIRKGLGMGLAVFVLSLMLLPASAGAQGSGMSQQAGQTEFSKEKIDSFIRSQGRIVQIQQRYQGQFEEAADNAERQSIMQQVNSEMVQAVQAEGLSPQEYNGIARQAQNDPALMQRLQEAQD